MSYFQFVGRHWRFLGFGFFLAFFSSFGQTYFIALFGGDIRETFGLSHGDFGFVYSVATLAAGLCLIWLGRRLDDVDLRVFSVLICTALIGACFLFAAVPSVMVLYVAIFALRLVGQGLMSHTALTSMSRYFDADRGKAISIASLGFPASQAVFPLMVVAMIASLGWRQAWLAFGAMGVVVLVPAVLWLLKGHTERHRALAERMTAAVAAETPSRRQWRLHDVLRDVRFYLVMPAVIAPGFLMTGVIFHQVHLVETKGWSLAWFATCFIAFGAVTLVSGMVAGPFADRYGAIRVLPYYLIPMAFGLAVLWNFDQPVSALVFLCLVGVTNGAARTISGAMWAETYGVAHLGGIRALIAAIQVFGTAISPVGMGWMLDAGIAMESIAAMCVGYIAAATVLTMIRMRM